MKTPTPIIQVSNQEQIREPAYIGDAGYDVIAISDPVIVGKEVSRHIYSHIDYIEYDTGLVVAPENGFHTYVFPRSSLSKTNLVLANSVAVIDNGYRGTIKLRFKYIPQPNDHYIDYKEGFLAVEVDHAKIYKKGDKIGQLVFTPTTTARIIESSNLGETERNAGGFGSSGS